MSAKASATFRDDSGVLDDRGTIGKGTGSVKKSARGGEFRPATGSLGASIQAR